MRARSNRESRQYLTRHFKNEYHKNDSFDLDFTTRWEVKLPFKCLSLDTSFSLNIFTKIHQNIAYEDSFNYPQFHLITSSVKKFKGGTLTCHSIIIIRKAQCMMLTCQSAETGRHFIFKKPFNGYKFVAHVYNTLPIQRPRDISLTYSKNNWFDFDFIYNVYFQ